jgi:hypothetical protein
METINEDFLKEIYLNVKDELKIKLENEFPSIFKIKTYKIGDKFTIDNELYILSRIDYNHLILINCETGNRFASGLIVNNVRAVTPNELNILMSGKLKDSKKYE